MLHTYTPAGQVAGITDSQGNAISYTYDSEGRRTGERWFINGYPQTIQGAVDLLLEPNES